MSLRVFTGSELAQLLHAIPARSAFGARDHAMFLLLLFTGLRVSEICGLTVFDVSHCGQPRDFLDLPAALGKGGHPRLLALCSRAQEAVRLLLAFNERRGFSVDPGQPLLVTRQGTHLPVRTFQSLLQRYREQAGLPARLTPHAFRHTMATHVARTTHDLVGLQQQLGHARLNTVQVYLKRHTPEQLLSMMQSTFG